MIIVTGILMMKSRFSASWLLVSMGTNSGQSSAYSSSASTVFIAGNMPPAAHSPQTKICQSPSCDWIQPARSWLRHCNATRSLPATPLQELDTPSREGTPLSRDGHAHPCCGHAPQTAGHTPGCETGCRGVSSEGEPSCSVPLER